MEGRLWTLVESRRQDINNIEKVWKGLHSMMHDIIAYDNILSVRDIKLTLCFKT